MVNKKIMVEWYRNRIRIGDEKLYSVLGVYKLDIFKKVVILNW